MWRTRSNSLIVLTAGDEQGLYTLVAKARARGIGYAVFREPDLCDEITAVAFTPSDATRKMLSNQPLVGRGADTPGHHLLVRRALARERRLRELAVRMEGCEQTPGQDVLAHGRSVREHYAVLRAHLEGTLDLGVALNWRLPAWVAAYRPQLAAAAGDEWLVDRYLTLHDAGKPDVVTVDEQGRRRFPGHGQRSPRVYLDTYRPADSPAGDAADDPAAGSGAGPRGGVGARDVHARVAELIAHDMDIHLLKAAGVEAFCANPNAVVHLLAGLAEVTSNAAMFGGVDSTSFKIKYKQLVSRGNAICAVLFGEPGQEKAL